MNFSIYGNYYGQFHKCSLSTVKQNIMIYNLGTAKYDTWFVSRMYPPDSVHIDSNKAFLLALKTFFKSDVPASVVCHGEEFWVACLGNERTVFPISQDVKNVDPLQLYATPFYVQKPDVINQYLQGTIRPAYEHVFFYKNTILYLDNEDLPYPGGSYFEKYKSTPYYRICFLSNEPTDYVVKVALDWKSRRGVESVLYMTREVECVPKFIKFQPDCDRGFGETNVLSTDAIDKTLSAIKPEHLIQDILNSYYIKMSRQSQEVELNSLGLIIEWPFILVFEGARYSERKNVAKTFVALSINGTQPNRILYVRQPYERYTEHENVKSTIWTPISFVLSTFLTDPGISKVAIDTVVIGVVYRKTFFCLNQPLLEGVPTTKPVVNGKYILSAAHFNLREDPNIQVIDTFKYNDHYSLHRVSLKKMSLDTWCLSESSSMDPYPKNILLPDLVKQWVEFFMEVGEKTFDMDINTVRLALMLSKHNICFNLNTVDKPGKVIEISEKAVNFYLEEKIVQFINDVRIITTNKEPTAEEKQVCSIS